MNSRIFLNITQLKNFEMKSPITLKAISKYPALEVHTKKYEQVQY